MIEFKNISKHYPKFVLKSTSFQIDRGEIVALIGANGAGKSTLIKCICGLIKTDAGEIVVDSKTVNRLDDTLTVGFLNQDQTIYEDVKIKELTSFYRSMCADKFDDDVYEKYFSDVFSLDKDYKIKELSTGMRVKYFLSLELAKRPDMIILDEPTSGMDPIIRDEVLDILKDIAEEERTSIFFSSHITEDIEKIADRVLFINDGEMKLNDTKTAIKNMFLQLDKTEYEKVKGEIADDKVVKVHDYYVAKINDDNKGLKVGKEALLSDVLSYIKRGGNIE